MKNNDDIIDDKEQDDLNDIYRFLEYDKEHISHRSVEISGLNLIDTANECTACGARYLLKSSLRLHNLRIVFDIRADCRLCKQQLHFQNRCQYWNHVRSHDDTDRLFSSIRILPMADVVDLYDNGTVDTMYESVADLDALIRFEFDDESSDMTASSIDQNVTTSVDQSSTLQIKSFGCTECKDQFLSADELRSHFVFNLPVECSQRQMVCPEKNCMAVYFSKCSYASHLRSHKSDTADQTPFTCPECGECQTTGASLSAHRIGHRTAPTLLNAWRCGCCSMFYSNFDTVLQHTVSSHCPFVFRCFVCTIICQDASSMHEHMQSSHPEIRIEQQLHLSDNSAYLAIQCFICRQCFANKEQLLEHLRTHANVSRQFQIYRCPICGRLLETRDSLSVHYDRIHRLKVTAGDINDKTVVATRKRKRNQQIID